MKPRRLIVLDTGPLGYATSPKATPECAACGLWLESRLACGERVAVPAIADYELRRHLLRGGFADALARLDAIVNSPDIEFLELTTAALRAAARLWAEARRVSRQTAADPALDADAILCAQASLAGEAGSDVIVATTNPKHLDLFVDARHWRDIT